MPYLRPFGLGLLGGLIGSIPHFLTFDYNVLESWGTILLLSPFILAASAIGLGLGRILSVSHARNWGALPGGLIGAIGLPLVIPSDGPWYLLCLAPALASGASSYTLALARVPRTDKQP